VFHLRKPDGLDGKSLAPLIAGQPDTHKIYTYSIGMPGSIAVRKDSAKFIMTFEATTAALPALEFYDLANDPLEAKNLFISGETGGYPVLPQLMAEAHQYVFRSSQPGPEDAEAELDEETEEALRALGYIE
jgi:hypothetical protein